MPYTATLHHDDELDGLTREGKTPAEASDRLADALSGHSGIKHVADFSSRTAGSGYVYRRFMPNIGHRITITEVMF